MDKLQFPCEIFKTQKRMDDYGADDMRYGDLSEAQLKSQFNLTDVSSRVNPYTLTKITPFNQIRIYGSRSEDEKVSRQECAGILFDEFRYLSRSFSMYGPYKTLIEKMISHMQYGNGAPFTDLYLDAALKAHILNDRSPDNSSRLQLKAVLEKNIDWEKMCYPEKYKDRLRDAIMSGKLPKFDRFQDNFNGMGITVHDTWATDITIKSLQISGHRFRAVVQYKIQDHFGLDKHDILNTTFKKLRFFRLWFVLQRYNQLGFKPFITNMEAVIEIVGERNESKK
ncbi:DUF3289 family protein [Enterobacteriaceae bacterium H20N1]|uniref:DUF3289 family protein n=1 Tax=Dryocola boscaweniae TaxID=2925397 RepID=A0A9X2W7X4_9ENTR|nr:YPO3983 family protein [Dryocola boscaweniae]MCT4701803.1 DUF3289 family protein [Dryocola boscaweniae]MCT4718971.1 DUF3289 family protein [Dryocola boscaweniae]